MKALIILISMIALAVSARDEFHEETVDLLLRQIRAELPKGWIASYDKTSCWLDVTREEEALATSAAENQPPGGWPSEKTEYSFAFRVVTKLDSAEYQRLNLENSRAQKEIAKISEDLRRRRVLYSKRGYLAKADEEKRLAEQYETLKKSLHRLPDYTFKDIGLEWGVNSPDYPLFYMTDERIQEECDHTQQNVIKLLTPIEGG